MRRGNSQISQTWLRKNHNAAMLLIGLLLLASLACNAFAGKLEPLPEPPLISEQPSSTSTPAEMAATATLDATISAVGATVSMLVDLNVRSGPGVQYDRVGFLSAGSSVAAVGVDKQSGWWKIQCPAVLDSDECWVSGRSQYVAVDNVQDVPTAVAPPTPTTIPPTVEAGQGLVAFLNDGQLMVAGLDLSRDPPQFSSDARQISRSGGVLRFSFSPDGRRIAYVAGTENANSLNIVNVDGGDQRTLVTSGILPAAGGQEPDQAAVVIDQIQWLVDGEGVAFNTSLLNLVGPGGGSQEDLWVATLDGELVESFPAGEGGGNFSFEADGQVILSRADELSRAVFDGQQQSTILQFEPVNTASEIVYYPAPQVTASGAYFSVPASDPWADGAETTLWQAPSYSPAVEIGRIPNIPINQPVVWSPDGQQAAFVQQTGSGEETAGRLVVAAADASGAIPYAGGPDLLFFAWQPGGTQFLYAGTGFYAVGQPQAPPSQILLLVGETAVGAKWLAGDSYLVSIIESANQRWELRSANISGETALLAAGPGLLTTFEVWLP